MSVLPFSSRSQTTALKQPKQLFCYARDIDNKFLFDEEEVRKNHVKYYYLPDSELDRGIDLSAGIAKFQKIPLEDNLAQFDQFLIALEQWEQHEQKKVDVDVIAFRGVMRKLMTAIYDGDNNNEQDDEYTCSVVGFDGQVFIAENAEYESKRLQRERSAPPDEYRAKCEYSGYKFETIATMDKPWSETTRTELSQRYQKQVNNYEQYLVGVRTGIHDIKVLMGAEVDCVWDYMPSEKGFKQVLDHYVELKTSRTIETPKQMLQFETKLFRTWAQCFLIGVKKIVYGFRDAKLVLRTVESYLTEEVPKMIKENPVNKNPVHKRVNCMQALKWYGSILSWLKQEVSDGKSYLLVIDQGRQQLRLESASDEQNAQLRSGQLLTERFINWRQNTSRTQPDN
ncbi:decapping endonuclease targeting mRNA [Scheffersomyces spartinae]|uniref:Decapping nuclease n=1 Tax=Scheffersomyces spartinae TaxID=45513 RepID=A0A9P7V9V4_9ASCO|nr:decapping endonuclease targeting mRNA [Scheffersomyces spartinae]KAG7193957.1 decapping endonuclease targeting mRNA [Scheffersomyces spartinae]